MRENRPYGLEGGGYAPLPLSFCGRVQLAKPVSTYSTQTRTPVHMMCEASPVFGLLSETSSLVCLPQSFEFRESSFLRGSFLFLCSAFFFFRTEHETTIVVIESQPSRFATVIIAEPGADPQVQLFAEDSALVNAFRLLIVAKLTGHPSNGKPVVAQSVAKLVEISLSGNLLVGEGRQHVCHADQDSGPHDESVVIDHAGVPVARSLRDSSR